jgi:predicted DCC family thiol-disulfide oxidoreductase YuxK
MAFRLHASDSPDRDLPIRCRTGDWVTGGAGGNPSGLACEHFTGGATNQTHMTDTAFTILIDGDCPLCRQEAHLLRRLDRGRGRLGLVDIASPGFDAARYGVTFDQVMGTIHGVTSDGRVVAGMEVFRRAYAAVGWGWLLAPTAWPVLRPIVDAAYRWFARNRLRLTGRSGTCENGRCRVSASAQPPLTAVE